jgi:glycosyltransferase involved in cell wall biosynthesis
MRIGVVTTSYPRHAGDHAGSFVGAHVAALRALGHDVEVIAAGDPRAPVDASHAGAAERVASSLFYGGGAPDTLERVGLRALPAAASFTARLTARVIQRARAWDAIVAHWLVPSAIAALAARKPLLAIGHGGDIHTLRRTHLLGPVLRALKVRGAVLSVVSEELAAICAPWIEARVQPMGIDVAHFAALGRAPTSPPTVAFIGRIVPVKGLDVLGRAIGHVRAAARFAIAGEDSNGPTGIVTFDARPEIHPVDILGAIDAARRDQLLREASVVVIPSRVLPNGRSEGVPLVALEALAAGVPVVASAVGGLRELPRIAGDAIALVPPDDPPGLAAAIDRVLAHPPPRADISHLDWSRVAPRLLPWPRS